MSSALMLWSIFLGALGMAYITYAKTQRKAVALIGGIVLLVLPYFTENNYLLLLGLVLVVGNVYFFNF